MYRSLLVAALAASTVIPFASAATTPFAVVDIKQVADSAPQVKKLKTTLEAKFKPLQEALVAKDKALRADIEKFNASASTLSKDAKSKAEKDLKARQAALREEQTKFQQEFFQEQNAGNQKFITELKDSVAKVAKKMGYDIVLQKNDAIALYSSSQINITQDIIRSLS